MHSTDFFGDKNKIYKFKLFVYEMNGYVKDCIFTLHCKSVIMYTSHALAVLSSPPCIWHLGMS